MKILITNDDGLFGLGLFPLIRELSSIGEVFVIVPEKEMSAVSHSFSLFTPVRVREHNINGYKIYAATGTPADCVRLGIIEFQKRKTDIVVAGINQGANLGQDVHYSGTVAAAREAVFLNKVGIAVSLVGQGNYSAVAEITKNIIKQIHNTKFNGLLNINFPAKKIHGIKITSLGKRRYQDIVHKRTDPFGLPYYWLKSQLIKNKRYSKDTDVSAVKNGFISITPLTYDLTNYSQICTLKKSFYKKIF